MDDISEYQKLYAVESAEYLQTMNEALLCLEKDAHNSETINAMFRAAHTLKGMSATMGYANIAELTHKMENLMDRVRKNEMMLDAGAIDTLFECLDALEEMIEVPENSAQRDISPLIEKILLITNKEECVESKQNQPEGAKAQNAPRGVNPPGISGAGRNVFNVTVTLDNSCTLKSARSTVILRNLSELGEIVETSPPVRDLESGKFGPEFRIRLSTKEDAEKIEDILKNILEVSDVQVRLEDMQSAGGQPEGAEPENAPREVNNTPGNLGAGCSIFNVAITLDSSCTLKSARSTVILRNLSELGEIVETSPPVRDLEGGKFGREFRIRLSTKEDAKKIEDIVNNILEVSSVEVKPERAQSAAQTSVSKEKIVEKERAAVKNIQSVRVSVERLDSLMNLVGELVINKIRLVQLASDYKIEALEEALSSLDHLTGELQEEVMASRMVPLEQIFNRFPRMIRDLAKIEGKEIELIITGSNIELDRTILDEIGDPLVHILRNCVDHGIELPEIRKQYEKNSKGTIKLAARREKNYVSIEVEDDGKGMNPEKFREVAVNKGIITKEEAAKLSDAEALNLSYLPGFTTAEKVTEISGRGVGLDVVKTKLEGMGGSVKLESNYGAGTKISLKLPLTVAIINSQMVKVGRNIYAIPITNVVRDVAIKKEQIKTIQSEEVVMIMGEVLPLIRLHKLFGVSSNDSDEMVVVVVERMNSNVGLVVDQVIGQQEVIIKSIDSRVLKGLKGFAGATILGDGNVALVLDVGTLL